MPLTSGARVGPYEVLTLLGAGGMGTVYRARDTRLDRYVAIKVLTASGAGTRHTERFHREAVAISRVNHPHICALYDVGQQDGHTFLVMELLEGETLGARLENGPLPLDRALDVAAQIADALDAAHQRGITHRDLKPSNVMLTRDGVKLLDFGIAKLRDVDLEQATLGATGTMPLTAEGVTLGTLPYMAPEQVEAKEVDERTDVFALGAVLWEMITGRRPFTGDTTASLTAAILTYDPPPVSSLTPQASPGLDRTIRKCLAKDPDQRWQTARDLASELRWLSKATATTRPLSESAIPRSSSRRLWWAAALGAAALLAGLALWQPLRAAFAVGASAPSLRWTPVTFSAGPISSARFAPDGETIIYSAAWTGRPYALYTTRRGSAESQTLSANVSRVASVSRNGEIAFIGGGQAAARLMAPGAGLLARVSLAGGGSRDLSANVTDADWNPVDSSMAIVRNGRVEWPIGTPIYTARTRLSHLRIAPSGERVALFEGDSLIVLDRAGAKQILASGFSGESFGGNVSLAWSPDGTEVWFGAFRDLTESPLKAVSLSGHERGLVQTPPGSFTIEDVLRDGRALVARHMARNGLSCLPPGEAQLRELAWLDASAPEGLSVDGRTVVFGENALGGRAAVSGGRMTLASYLRPTNGDSAIRLGDGYPEDLSADASAVLVSIREDPPLRWVIVPTGPGEPTTLPPGPFDAIGEANFLSDGKRIVFGARQTNRPFRIWVQDVKDGPPRAISPEGVGTNALPTPDGAFVLGVSEGRSTLYAVDSDEVRPLPHIASDEEALQWSPDGRHLFVRKHRTWPPVVDRVDVTTGRREEWRTMFPADPVGVDLLPRIVLTPDGRSYCFHYYRAFSELFVVEGIK